MFFPRTAHVLVEEELIPVSGVGAKQCEHRSSGQAGMHRPSLAALHLHENEIKEFSICAKAPKSIALHVPNMLAEVCLLVCFSFCVNCPAQGIAGSLEPPGTAGYWVGILLDENIWGKGSACYRGKRGFFFVWDKCLGNDTFFSKLNSPLPHNTNYDLAGDNNTYRK